MGSFRRGQECAHGALFAIDSATGEIVAYVGSVDYYNREDPRVRPVRCGWAGSAPTGSASSRSLQSRSGPARPRGDLLPGRGHPVRFVDPVPCLFPDQPQHQGAGPVCHGRAALPAERPVGDDAVLSGSTSPRSSRSRWASPARSTSWRGSGPDPHARLGPGQPDQHDAGYSVFAAQARCHPAKTVIEIRRPRRKGHLQHRRQRPGQDPADDAGRGLPTHGSWSATPTRRATCCGASAHAAGCQRRTAPRRIQDRDHQRLHRRLRLRYIPREPDAGV